MATAEQVKALLKSYGEGNGEHFASVALQIAADAARGGKGQLAQQLRDLVDDIKRKQAAGEIRRRRSDRSAHWRIGGSARRVLPANSSLGNGPLPRHRGSVAASAS